jgi:soluble lytic murein transglycosylase-like protein
MWQAIAPYAIPAGLSLAQGFLGGRQTKRDEKRREEQAKQDKLLAAFGQQPSQQPQQYSQPSAMQRIAHDPITRNLLADLAKSDKFFGGKLAFTQ